MLRVEVSEYLGETSSNRPLLTARMHICFGVFIVCICQVGPFLLRRFILLLPLLLLQLLRLQLLPLLLLLTVMISVRIHEFDCRHGELACFFRIITPLNYCCK